MKPQLVPQLLPIYFLYLIMLTRSEEHTSELQSLAYLVCRLLLEKKNRQDRRHDRLAAGVRRPELPLGLRPLHPAAAPDRRPAYPVRDRRDPRWGPLRRTPQPAVD